MQQIMTGMDQKRIEITVKSLKEHQFDVYIAENEDVCKEIVRSLIPLKSSVNIGGSITLFDCGIYDMLKTMDICFQDRYNTDDTEKIFRDAFSCGTYITGTNALTMNGELYNVDGNGNRVAAMLYGPEQVIVIVGANKIVKDINEAALRVKTIAAPMNCRRLGKVTPCSLGQACTCCNGKDTICNDYVVIRRSAKPKRIKIIIIEKEFGY